MTSCGKYIITHKPFDLDIYDRSKFTVIAPKGVVIQGWADVRYFETNMDNRVFSELAGMKYLADNTDTPWVQVNHYRRLLTDYPGHNTCAAPVMLPESNAAWYARFHNVKDLSICSAIIQKSYPKQYGIWLDTLKSNVLYPYNMVNLQRDVFTRYINIMTDIVTKFAQAVGCYTYDDYMARVNSDPVYTRAEPGRDNRPEYQVRIPGFLCERITTWFLNCASLDGLVLYPMVVRRFGGAW